MAMNKFRDILERFSDQLILVIGDCMLDEYVYGDVRRVSPEAPVPVVDVERVECVPGGAANTALNIRALGAHCRLVGVVGVESTSNQNQISIPTSPISISISVDEVEANSVAFESAIARRDHRHRLRRAVRSFSRTITT